MIGSSSKLIGKSLSNLAKFRSNFSTSANNATKVALVGAGGGIGQPLSLLLKHSQYISNLALYDLKKMEGVALDLDHIDTSSQVYSYADNQLASCLDGAEVVVITAGVARKPGMQRSDLFNVNAEVVMKTVDQICKSSLNPLIAIVTNPVNSLVPVAAEVLRLNGMFDIRKLFGVTTLDVVRANTFYARMFGLDPREVNVPVVGGHSGDTIVPLFSIAEPAVQGSEDVSVLTNMVREAGTHVVQAKNGEGSATLSMAYSAFRFVNSLLEARLGRTDLVECAYIYQKFHNDVDFFTDPIKLGHEGVSGSHTYQSITDSEMGSILKAKEQLRKDIQLGYDYVKKNYTAPQGVEPAILGRASDVKISNMWNVKDRGDLERENLPPQKGKFGDINLQTDVAASAKATKK